MEIACNSLTHTPSKIPGWATAPTAEALANLSPLVSLGDWDDILNAPAMAGTFNLNQEQANELMALQVEVEYQTHKIETLSREAQSYSNAIMSIAADCCEKDRRIAELEQMLGLPPEHPTPDYTGPTASDGTPMPDRAHENWHQGITDALAGRIMPKARDQMRDALNSSQPLLPPQTTSTSKPLPRNAFTAITDNRYMGIVEIARRF